MRKIEHRVRFCTLILLAFIAGIIGFLVRYHRQSERWYEQSFNKHLYSDTGELLTGTLTDRNGVVLSSVENGTRKYAISQAVRMATLHTVGDSAGKIGTGALSNLRDYLVSYRRRLGANLVDPTGNTVVLALDSNACVTALDAMNGAVGCVGVYNYKTGEIVCLVSTPTYDPTDVPADIETNDSYRGAYVNRFFYSTFTPGSVFKTVTLQAVLENIDGAADEFTPDAPRRTYTCEGSVKVGDNIITCPKKHGTQTLMEAYANSCNCVFASLAAELGGETMSAYVTKAGLTSSYKIHNFQSAKGSFELASASAYQLGWSGVGLHHDLVNPCSLMIYLGAIANGGKAAVPTYIARVLDENGKELSVPKTVYTEELIAPSTARIVRGLMENNVIEVYGRDRFPAVAMGAKSGTIEQKTGKSNCWFAGFVLSDEYPYAFVVYLEHAGSGSGAAGDVAAAVLNALIPVP